MLREDPSARFEPGLLRCRFVSGRRDFRPMSRTSYRAILRGQRESPVAVAVDERRTWWMFRDRIYWEDDALGADEVMALALERERRRRRRLDRAVDAMAAERAAGPPRREAIPEEVRRRVFRRDGGRCARCGSDELLQFDHVIPVALGGSSSAENLQLMCAPCNREKGDAL